MERPNPRDIAAFRKWLFEEYAGLVFPKFQRVKYKPVIVTVNPRAPISLTSAETYFKWVRSYIKQTRRPDSRREANKFLQAHPNPSARRALSLYFQWLGKPLVVDEATQRVISRFSKEGVPDSDRQHELIHEDEPWKVWADLIDRMPMEGIPEEDLEMVRGSARKYLRRAWIWKHIKAIACLQLLWGLRAGDVIKITDVHLKRTKGDIVLKIRTLQKGWRKPQWKEAIALSDIRNGSHPWLEKYFQYVVEYFKERGVMSKPFLYITNPNSIGSKTISPSTIYVVYYAAIRYLADKLYGKRQSTHDIRRAVITQLLDEGKPLPLIQNWIGHAKAEQTAKYYKRKSSARAVLS